MFLFGKAVHFRALILYLVCVPFALACDLCSIYNSVDSAKPAAGTVHFGLAEQFASYGKVQKDGRKIENSAHQHMQSSTTQVYAAYDLSEKFSVQANLPYINRRFKRLENESIETGTEAGIGDSTLIAKYIPYQYRDQDTTFFIQILGGLKLPTGDTDQLGSEVSEEHHDHEDSAEPEGIIKSKSLRKFFTLHEDHNHVDPDQIAGTIHGHDLALGSGSYDFPFGINLFSQYERYLMIASLQYSLRTEGDFDYEYADDLLWDIGPGYFLSLGHDYAVYLKANLSGEYKRKDKIGGEYENDTGLRSIFLGPELIFTADKWSAEIAWDLPLDINNTGLQSVADYKLRAALSYRF